MKRERVTMAKFGVGQAVRRVEDPRLLTGRGRYTDDINLPGQAYAALVRSPHAHPVIRRLDEAAARSMPGVLAVLTGADIAADKVDGIHCKVDYKNLDGSTMVKPVRPALAQDRVRFVGDIVAVAIAGTPAQARDAADAVA